MWMDAAGRRALIFKQLCDRERLPPTRQNRREVNSLREMAQRTVEQERAAVLSQATY